MHRVIESSIIDVNNSNEHVIYLLYESEWIRVAKKEQKIIRRRRVEFHT